MPINTQGWFSVDLDTTFESGAKYEVRLCRNIMIARRPVRPSALKIVIEGDVATDNRDSIIMAREAR